ncbi:Uncharacterised protein [Chryseobacterium taklimakanense]|uniref:Uncharacterized protein n=1 Tax=Chryseobacterium taklimakanense TaxID=536441 RepID=A0A239XTV0_9FLAO|nr:Uncharacterised protein [Chryseobacterium taklimakanense]
MKHKLGDIDRINHIVDSIEKIEKILEGVSMRILSQIMKKALLLKDCC